MKDNVLLQTLSLRFTKNVLWLKISQNISNFVITELLAKWFWNKIFVSKVDLKVYKKKRIEIYLSSRYTEVNTIYSMKQSGIDTAKFRVVNKYQSSNKVYNEKNEKLNQLFFKIMYYLLDWVWCLFINLI